MVATKIGGIDLNLLSCFHALLIEGQVTAAAHRLGVTQPAMSKSIGRLRKLFKDELFIISRSEIKKTPVCCSLEPLVMDLVNRIEQLVGQDKFNPKTSQRMFKLAASDYINVTFLPKFLGFFSESWAVDLNLVSIHGFTSEDLMKGLVDLVITKWMPQMAKIPHEKLWSDRYVVVMRDDHHLAKKTFKLKHYLQAKHIIWNVSGGTTKSEIDHELERQGIFRQVKIEVPSFISGLKMLEQTDYLMTIPYLFWKKVGQFLSLAIKELPFEVGEHQVAMAWSPLFSEDKGHLWLRSSIKNNCKNIFAQD